MVSIPSNRGCPSNCNQKGRWKSCQGIKSQSPRIGAVLRTYDKAKSELFAVTGLNPLESGLSFEHNQACPRHV